MATEWFGVHLPCITLFTVTFHWMTLLICSLLCCCCCSPCCIAAAAFGLQGKGGSKGGQHIDLAWIPPAPDEEKEGLMNGYGDVFPAELRRMPYKKEQKPKSSINFVPYLFCCLIFFFVLCLLIIPFVAWSSYQLYNQIMEELFEPSPLWMWVSILIISTMAGCIGFPSFFLRSEGAPKKVTIYCPACLGCIVFTSACGASARLLLASLIWRAPATRSARTSLTIGLPSVEGSQLCSRRRRFWGPPRCRFQ